MTYASLGGLGENAQIHLTLNKTENTSLNQSQLADLGINTHLSTTSITTKDQITRALNTSLSIDNHLFSQEGREQIGEDFKNLGNNVSFISQTLTQENIVLQVLGNMLRDPSKDGIEATKDYLHVFKEVQEVVQEEELNAKLNGLTNLSALGVQETLQEVIQIAEEDQKQTRKTKEVTLYNNETNTRGYLCRSRKKLYRNQYTKQ